MIYGLFGEIVDEKEKQKGERLYMNDTLATYLASSLNIELVHIILKGITKFSKVGFEQIDTTE